MKAGGTNRGPDLEGLRAFVREGDRNRARFFVGREAQIRDIERVCADAFAGFRSGRPLAGATRLIHGAPGAGKTALLSHIAGAAESVEWRRPGAWRRFLRKADENEPRPGALLVDVVDLGHPARLVLRIAERLDPKRAKKLRQTESRSIGVRAGTGGFGVSGGETVATAPPQTVFSELGALFPPEDWPGPLCLMVDEIQTLRAEQAPVLQSLHLATVGLPIVPVLAGLANARDVLARCGISRLNEDGVHTLGRLEAGKPAEAVRMMLDAYRVNAAGADAGYWAARLEEHSDGWPQHLQNAMRSLAEALVEAKGALAAVDEAAALARARERRLRAYRSRRSPEMQEAIYLLARVMAEMPEAGLRRSDAVGSIRSLARDEGDCGWRLPEGMSPSEFLDHLVHRGALQSGEDDRLVCPIPSFRRFLIEEGARAFAESDGGGLTASDPAIAEFVDEATPELDADDPGPQPR